MPTPSPASADTGRVSADKPLAAYEGATIAPADERFLMADHQGSVVLAFDGGLAQRRLNSYDEWGIPGGDLGVTQGGRFRYTGQAWIPEQKCKPLQLAGQSTAAPTNFR